VEEEALADEQQGRREQRKAWTFDVEWEYAPL